MTLRGFHIIFIVASTTLALFFGWWAYQQYQETQAVSYITTAFVSWAAGLGLVVYGITFAKKVKA